ncbi:AAA family ATPase [Fuchsiella alkaliacetigena]|uniref:AAA family ATPase n=1 Tax=Fuchsiella alkaliacetigena TaxID=957042 RepID=UPI002009F886|nr:MoxR family ATPase [Fuchsiella alkaliacetigena]MCK8825679.1 MoxR family ATPase [Fuchsiella alkaliacetigena]
MLAEEVNLELLDIAIEEYLQFKAVKRHQREYDFDKKLYFSYEDELWVNLKKLLLWQSQDYSLEKAKDYLYSFLAEYFVTEGYAESFSETELQQFIFAIGQYKELEFKLLLRYLHRFSCRLHDYQHHISSFIEAIANLDEGYLATERNLEGESGVVKELQARVIQLLFEQWSLSLEQLENLKEEIKKEYQKQSLKPYTDNFRLLFGIYYNYYKEQLRYCLHRLLTILKSSQPLVDCSFAEGKVVDFFGSRNLGATDCWLALYPQAKTSHRRAAQLFMKISLEGVEYGLNLGSELETEVNSDLDLESSLDNLNLEQVLAKFQSVLPKYRQVNDEVEMNQDTGSSGQGEFEPVNYDKKLLTVDFKKELNIDGLYFPNWDFIKQQIKAALQNNKHLLLLGPPGTGKSKLARQLCQNYGVDFKLVTANSDWSTFDTIGGYRPDKEGRLYFDAGLFLECFKDRETAQPQNQWLIIDELNRADIDKAFGSLFSALTGETVTLSFKNEKEQNIVLKPQPKAEKLEILAHQYLIPEDWRLIATMNTFDKASLYELSYAFMRRLAFISVPVPKEINEDLLQEYLRCWQLEDSGYIVEVVQLWQLINQWRQVGPAVIEDLYRHLVTTQGDYAGGLMMYVLAQLEGLLANQLEVLFRELISLEFIENPELLLDFAEDYFGLEELTDAREK